MIASLIFPEYLSGLFLEKEEKALVQELKALVVLDPDLLVDTMRVVMELKTTRKVELKEVQASLIRELEVTGIADLKLLGCCWRRDFTFTPAFEMHHLCLMLQASCLIYPVQPVSGNPQKYIIPSKLPNTADTEAPGWVCRCATFYFDFNKFLPDEIYHRLICLASSEAIASEKNCYSSKCCIFCELEGTNWVLEVEGDKLKIRVM
jgi:hypothetical protein